MTSTEAGAPSSRDVGVEDAVLRTVLQHAPDGILMTDEAGEILYANRRAHELFGFGADALRGRSVDDLLPDRVREVHRAHRARYRSEPHVRAMGVGLLLFGRRADGTEFPVEVGLSPSATDEGLRVVAIVRDVTDRLEAEAHQRMVREALDATRDAVLILDADTLRFVYANQGAVDQVGYSQDELLEMTMLDIAPSFTDQQLRELLAPLACGEQSAMMFTTVHRHRDGTDLPVEILMQAIRDDHGAPVRYVKVVRDIRERLQTEDRLQRAEQHLRIVEDRERIARELHDVVIQKLFAAGMSVQSVAVRSDDPRHAERLTRVVDDLDDTIREIRSVIFGLQAETKDAPGVRAGVLRIVDDEQAALGFAPRIRFDGPVDTTSDRVSAELFPVLREALSNVARHAEASSVEIELERNEALVTLRVLDDGRGLPADTSGGNGLRNLSERAAKLGGFCRTCARAEGGTLLEWQVPDPASGVGPE
jgi:PAS domain S-box-containing protein